MKKLFICFLVGFSLVGCKKKEDGPQDLLLGHWKGVSVRGYSESEPDKKKFDDTTGALTATLEFRADGTFSPGISYKLTGTRLGLQYSYGWRYFRIKELINSKLVFQDSVPRNTLPQFPATTYDVYTFQR